MTFPCCDKALREVINYCSMLDNDGEPVIPVLWEVIFKDAKYCSGCGAPLKCPHCGRFL